MPSLLRTTTTRLHVSYRRALSSCAVARTNRALIYQTNGEPVNVLRAAAFPPLPAPATSSVNIRYLLSPINPSDINVIQGVYPAKPQLRYDLSTGEGNGSHEPVFIAGNEGLAEVREVGPKVEGLKKGDWVVMMKPQAGTWAASANVGEGDVIKVQREEGDGLSEVHAATMTVNPPTAYNMLRDFVDLKPGEWVVQNGANSAVGQAVIQIATHRGLKTLNLVRNRDDIDVLKDYLKSIGATEVVTFEELEDKTARAKIKESIGGADVRLGLNCVSGKPTSLMASLLGKDSHLVSYGAMSKQPLTLSTGLFIFKNLKAHGFWQSRWYQEKGRGEREALMQTLAQLMSEGKLREPEHEIVSIPAVMSDAEATEVVKGIFERLNQGRLGKKMLLRFEDA